jgi:predicted ribosome quality control (RQC) complex YloA/Tae2 family protein
MHSNYYTLKYLAATAEPILAGGLLTGMFTQEKDELIITFESPRPSLVISCRPTASTCYLHGGIARARRNSTDVLTECRDVRLTGLSIAPGDRVIRLQLEQGFVLASQFFGPKSNVLLLRDGLILDAFKHSRELSNTRYDPREEEIIFDFVLLRQMMEGNTQALVSTMLRSCFPALGATLVD